MCTTLTALASQWRLFNTTVSDYVSGDVLNWILDADPNSSQPFKFSAGDPYADLYLEYLSNLSPIFIPLLNAGSIIGTILVVGLCARTISQRASIVTAALIALNPFFWMSALGPSKEPSLVCLVAISLALIMKSRLPWLLWVFAGLMSISAFFYRMEFALVIAVGTALIISLRAVRLERWNPKILVGVALIGMVVIPYPLSNTGIMKGRSISEVRYETFSSLAPSDTGALSVEISRKLAQSSWTAPVGVIYRLVISSLRAPLRPAVRSTDGRVPLYTSFLWLTEFIVTFGLIASLIILLKRDCNYEYGKTLAAFNLALAVMIGCYPIVQTRYFIPISPFMLILVCILEKKTRVRLGIAVIAIAVIGPILLALLGHPPVPTHNTDLVEGGNCFLNPLIDASSQSN